jgi:hypothetical protein
VAEAKKTAQNCAKRRTVEQDVRAAEESRVWRNFGVLCWAIYLRRLTDRPTSDGSRDPATTPPVLRPTLGIQLAPPTIGCSAYLSITSGPPDLFAQMLLGDGLFQALLLLWGRLLPPPLLPPPESLHPTPRVI